MTPYTQVENMKRLILFVMLSIGLLQGCHRGLDKDVDADEAAKALQTALEAWESGKSREELEKMTPSILINEDDWRTGKRLLEFKVENCSLSGRQIRSRVQLKLQDKNGKTLDRRATYIIDTTPRIVIVRDVFAGKD
jgi:hypothetical protein